MNLALSVLAPRSPARPGVPPPAPPEAHRAGRLLDSYGRAISNLRLSITDRCNFRCVYCMDPDVRFMDQRKVLTTGEWLRLTRVCAGMGVRHVRLTGGEPTLHPHLPEIIAGLAAIPGIDISMTTNGSLLDDRSLAAWRHAGLSRLTVSIDSVDERGFASITRSRTTAATVLDGIAGARRAGLNPVKLNAVVVRGVNEDQVVALAALARRLAVEMRFIEFMPLDSGHRWDRSRVVTAAEITSRIDAVYPLVPLGRDEPSSTALEYAFADGSPGRIGVIASVSRPFCGACSRLRITADGKVRPCLFGDQEWDIRALLRNGADDEAVRSFLVDATWTKKAGHGVAIPEEFLRPDRPMSAIGG